MRKYLLILLFSGFSILSFAITPHWVRHLPSAENSTYYYVVESATASTEDAARNKATGLVLQRAIQSLGLSYDSRQVENAIRSGMLESHVENFSIPVKKVCTYRQKVRGGGVRVYVLYQVAVAGNIQAQFTPYNDCGSQGSGDDDISMRPEEWGLFEGDTYFSSSSEDKLGRGEKVHDVTNELLKEVKDNLIENLGIKDNTLISMIETKNAYDEASKTVFTIAYIEKKKIVETYQLFLEQEMEVADTQLSQIESRIQSGDPVNAIASIHLLQTRLDSLNTQFNFLRAYASSYALKTLNAQHIDLNTRCGSLLLSVDGDHQASRENKIREFTRNGFRALKNAQVGDALRYYYGAQVLLADLPNATTFTDTIPTPKGLIPVTMNVYLQQRIKDILSNISVVCDGFYAGSDSDIKMSFYYSDPNASNNTLKAISNMKFTYNDNTRWSEQMSVKDGWSIISTSAGSKPHTIHVRCEYRYEDEAMMDPELQEKMQKYKRNFNYDDVALHIVDFETKTSSAQPVTQNASQSPMPTAAVASQKESTDILQNFVANKVQETSHRIPENEIPAYRATIDKVCDAIASKDYQGVYTLFTADGYNQFTRLIQYGSARIISRQNLKFVKLGSDIQCRYIPMEFVFKKGRHEFENVVFTFNETKKIDGVQFALEERAARNIMGDTRYSETSKLVLVNFIENYKTAFALKRLDYIESIFSEDAIIITGRVLHKSEKVDDNQVRINKVIYSLQTKQGYINRLKSSFASKEWINIKFGNTVCEKSAQGEQYGVKMMQDYYSDNYGDRGNLFLLIDCRDQEHPLIRVRVWEAEIGDKPPFSLVDYDYLTNL